MHPSANSRCRLFAVLLIYIAFTNTTLARTCPFFLVDCGSPIGDCDDGPSLPATVCQFGSVLVKVFGCCGANVTTSGAAATVQDFDCNEPSEFFTIHFLQAGQVVLNVEYLGCTVTHTFTVVDATSPCPNPCLPFAIVRCDSCDPPPANVCPNSTLCLRAVNGQANGDCHWVIDGSGVSFIGGEIGATIQLAIGEAANAYVYPLYPCNSTPHNFTNAYIVTGAVDLDIDSNNNAGFGPPATPYEEATYEDGIEDDLTKPGKIIFVNKVDDDDDDVPGFGDGVDEFLNGAGGSQAWFVPVLLRVPNPYKPDTTIAFTYSASDPAGVYEDPTIGSGDDKIKPAPVGRLRLWKHDANLNRSMQRIGDGGDFVPGDGTPCSITSYFDCMNQYGVITLWLEAVKPSLSVGADTILVQVSTDQNSDVQSCGWDQVRVTAVELEVLDLRFWGPLWIPTPSITDPPTEGVASILNSNLYQNEYGYAKVGGAITDGASICLLRVNPSSIYFAAPTWTISVSRRSNNNLDPAEVGTIYQAGSMSDGHQVLPPLPTPWPVQAASNASFNSGMAYFVPPESYDCCDNGEVNHDEGFYVDFAVKWNDVILGKTKFILRRPPIILVHGILSSAETWGDSSGPWSELDADSFPMNAVRIPTRKYRVDYGPDSSLGYAENYGKVALTIDNALNEYRNALDNGLFHPPDRSFHRVHYAATRADVVGHSMGGQLARFYAAMIRNPGDTFSIGMMPRNSMFWPPMGHNPTGISRDDPHVSWANRNSQGRWPYLRDDNFGAGNIRRLVTMGSPFRGSPVAPLAAHFLEPTEENLTLLNTWLNLQVGSMPATLRQYLYPGWPSDLTYQPPTCAADLSPMSAAQQLLQDGANATGINFTGTPFQESGIAFFPRGYRSVNWFPLVGITADMNGDIPAGSFLDMFRIIFDGDVQHLLLGPITDWDTSGDFVVPEVSQRDGIAQSFVVHHKHSHSAPLPPYHETTSWSMALHISELLQAKPDMIWLEPLTDSDGTVLVPNGFFTQFGRLSNVHSGN